MQELNYIRCGDYYIPDIRLPDENRPNDSCNWRSKENICRQTNNSLNVVIFDQVAANATSAFALTISSTQCITTEQDTMRKNYGHNSVRLNRSCRRKA